MGFSLTLTRAPPFGRSGIGLSDWISKSSLTLSRRTTFILPPAWQLQCRARVGRTLSSSASSSAMTPGLTGGVKLIATPGPSGRSPPATSAVSTTTTVSRCCRVYFVNDAGGCVSA